MVTADEIPNLFGVEPRALTLYELLLLRLMMSRHDEFNEFVEVCRIVRSYAVAAKIEHAADTFAPHEVDALGSLGRWEEALALADASRAYWQDLLRPIELAARFIHEQPRILYYLGRHEESAAAFEWAIGVFLDHASGWTEDLALHVCCPDAQPDLYQVSLNQPYTALGKSLTSWMDWDRFIDGLSVRLLEVAGMDADAVRADPTMLLGFCKRLRGTQRCGSQPEPPRDEADVLDPGDDSRSATDATVERYFGHILDRG